MVIYINLEIFLVGKCNAKWTRYIAGADQKCARKCWDYPADNERARHSSGQLKISGKRMLMLLLFSLIHDFFILRTQVVSAGALRAAANAPNVTIDASGMRHTQQTLPSNTIKISGSPVSVTTLTQQQHLLNQVCEQYFKEIACGLLNI